MKKVVLNFILFVIALIAFILQIFVFSKPNGTLGLILCIVFVETIIFTGINLFKMSKTFKEILSNVIELLFRI